MSKSVCIVGAGPSGLVAAKTLLHNAPAGEFRVTVLDAQSAIGGLWPLSRADTERQVHPLMAANQSKHTVHFSDLAWDKDAPQFPLAWQVGQYLQRYTERYLTSQDGFTLRTDHKVVGTRQVENSWEVDISSDGKTTTEMFDYLIVATGFFGKPIMPAGLSGSSSKIPVIHSSQYRDLKGLLAHALRNGDKIVVVGGQMSGIEIAGTIGVHLSSAINSPGDFEVPNVDSYKIHHIVQRPTWILPLFTTPEISSKAPPFLPMDFGSYNRSHRPPPLVNTQGHITQEAAALTASRFEAVLGTDQSEYSPHLHVREKHKQDPAYLAVSDWYCELVRSGLIHLSTGKAESIEEDAVVLSTGAKIENVAAVVVATGFDPNPCLDFLPQAALEKMHHSKEHLDHPLALAFHGTHHPEVPRLGFVGFYRSPYWGVMQMQARTLARLWSHSDYIPAEQAKAWQEKLEGDVSIQRTLDLRKDPRCSQFPMGDYPFLMAEMAEAISIPMSHPDNSDRMPVGSRGQPMDPLSPSRYPDPGDSEQMRTEAAVQRRDTVDVSAQAYETPRFVSKAIFRSLLGTWSLERDLTSRLPSHPSGHFSGTARFLIRQKTADGVSKIAAALPEHETALEYLYIEDGEFRTDNGFSFNATRRYVWRYDEKSDKISVWFVQPEHLKRADYLFHDIELVQPLDEQPREGQHGGEKSGTWRDQPWRAKAGHLCIDDYYDVKYEFSFKAINLSQWKIDYTVNGPKKDYSISGVYKRR